MANEPQEPKSPKVRQNERNVLARKPGEDPATGWMKGPAHLSVTSLTHKGLIGVARARGLTVNQVDWIRVANIEGDRRIWLYPVDEFDPLRIPLQSNKSKYYVNLSQPLLDWNMTLPTGQRNRYDILPDTKNESPVGPALWFDIDQPLEVKHDKGKSPARQAAPGKEPGADRNDRSTKPES